MAKTVGLAELGDRFLRRGFTLGTAIDLLGPMRRFDPRANKVDIEPRAGSGIERAALEVAGSPPYLEGIVLQFASPPAVDFRALSDRHGPESALPRLKPDSDFLVRFDLRGELGGYLLLATPDRNTQSRRRVTRAIFRRLAPDA